MLILPEELRKQPNLKPVICQNRSWWKRTFIHNHCYKVHNDPGYYYYFLYKGKLYRCFIKKDYTCDLTSMPRLLWPLTGMVPYDLAAASSLFHDWSWEQKGILDVEIYIGEFPRAKIEQLLDSGNFSKQRLEVTRKWTDKEFRHRAISDGVKPGRAKRAYRKLRMFGWIKNNW